MTLHPDLNFPTPEELARLTPEELAARTNGPEGGGLSGNLWQTHRHPLSERDPRTPERAEAGSGQPSARRTPARRREPGAGQGIGGRGIVAQPGPPQAGGGGVDLGGTHIRGVSSGVVTGEAALAYRGRSMLVWTAVIKDERGRLTSLARCTCNVVSVGDQVLFRPFISTHVRQISRAVSTHFNAASSALKE